MPEISIVVPVYNVEKYLHKCLDSILVQTFKDFELILVDDGSQDRSGKICDEYARKDNRVRVIHKNNGGLSDARNVGIDIAKGKYIGFVDSDDYIAIDMYETLHNNISKYNADIASCGIFHCYQRNNIKKNTKNTQKVLNNEEFIEVVMAGTLGTVNACNKLYKISLFENIRYLKGNIYEDAYIIVDLLRKVEIAVIDTTQKYYYLHRTNSITKKIFSTADYDLIFAYSHNLDLVRKYYPKLLTVAYYRYWWAHFHLLNKIALCAKDDRRIYKDDITVLSRVIQENFWSVLNNSYQSLGKRIAYLLIYISPNFYMKIYHWWFFYVRALIGETK